MKLEELWSVDKRIFWRMSFWWFLIMELILRIKLGVIFWLCFGWFLVLNWQARIFWGKSLGKNQPEVILKSIFYAFLVSLLIFLVFSGLNFLSRWFFPQLDYFQLP